VDAGQKCGQAGLERRLKLRQPSKPKPKLAAIDRRRQLVTIAMDLIAVKGFEGLRFQEVAKEAGINSATLFYHFSTKEELIQGVMQHLVEEFSKNPARPVDKRATAVEELRLEFASVGELLRGRPKLFLVLTELSLRALRDPLIEGVVKNMDEFWRRHLTSVLRLGIEQGEFRPEIDVEATATAMMAQIKGIGFHALTGKLKSSEVDQAVSAIARQTEHWLCTGRTP
jgi:AcrR family transcriptional regulator